MIARALFRFVFQQATMLRHDRRGATAIEYGLVLTLVVIVLIASLKLLAGTTIGIWTDVSTKVVNAG